jgi:hypothetical protein
MPSKCTCMGRSKISVSCVLCVSFSSNKESADSVDEWEHFGMESLRIGRDVIRHVEMFRGVVLVCSKLYTPGRRMSDCTRSMGGVLGFLCTKCRIIIIIIIIMRVLITREKFVFVCFWNVFWLWRHTTAMCCVKRLFSINYLKINTEGCITSKYYTCLHYYRLNKIIPIRRNSKIQTLE